MEQRLWVACICATLCAWEGCAPQRVRPAPRTETSGPERAQTPAGSGGLALRVLLDGRSYAADDVISLQVTLNNEGNAPLGINRRTDPYVHLILHFRDAWGQRIRSQEIRVRPKRLTDPREILQLEPGYVYGVRLRLVPKRKGLLGARYYSLVYPPATEVDQKFFLEAAGDYSLTVTYQAADDGHAAGVAAWVGSVDSNAVPFSISP